MRKREHEELAHELEQRKTSRIVRPMKSGRSAYSFVLQIGCSLLAGLMDVR